MDSKVSYTKVEDVECLLEEKEEPQVVSARKVGKIRGFFIMVAALSLTIFIGLVVVVVINDINDRPRHNGYYGHSSEIAQHEGCRFHIMSLEWLRGGCQDVESIERFRSFGPGDWYTDTDLDEPCDREWLPGRAEGSP
jgi:hypothetical protein